jgi:hypothetical protein
MSTTLAIAHEVTVLVHFNLNRGTLEVAERRGIVAQRYGPLLELVERESWLRLALAVSGHTLERIERLERGWCARLRELCAAGRIAFVGTGDTQLVGPLVPAAVNRWNQALGRETYRRLLGNAPRVALVDHMAWSQGLVDAYLDAGYEALVVGGGAGLGRERPVWTASPTGRRIRLLLVQAERISGLRRALAGELSLERLADELVAAPLAEGTPARGSRARGRHVWLYAEDAELGGERFSALCAELHARGLEFTTPERVLDDPRNAALERLELGGAANPVPVLDEPSLGLARWALAGWDDLGLNARCFARAKELEQRGGTDRDWQLLCRAWGSDLRTDLSERRWRRLAQSLPPARPPEPSGTNSTAFVEPILRVRLVERAGRRLALGTDGVRVVLDLGRGLALDALTLVRVDPRPLLGARPASAGDAGPEERRCGHAVLSSAGQAPVSDLEPVVPEVEERSPGIVARATVPTARGALAKEVRVYAQRVELRYGFGAFGPRPAGSLRAGILTLLDGVLGERLWVSCANGGPRERWVLSAPSGSTRDTTVALGATDGWLALDDGERGFEVSWPQEEAAVLPLLLLGRRDGRRVVRLAFSLAEADATQRAGAPLRDFRLSIRPYRNRR